jgi:endonuclease/exonuclease/phosphatase family metal-dependent hydrolase
MRLVSYNILDGGKGRADPLAEVIVAQRPDIVALVEADDPDVVDRIADRLDMDRIVVEGRRHGAAILCRWTIVESINHALLSEEFSDCLLEAQLAGPDGRAWTVAAVHLHPHATDADERRREREIEAILRIFSAHRRDGVPHILAGDFNANSPIQDVKPQDCKPRTRKEILANGGALPRRAIEKLLESGYVDTLDVVDPGAARSIGSFTTQYPGQRVDYILTHGIEPARLTGARIEQDRLAQYASDHFPMMVQID